MASMMRKMPVSGGKSMNSVDFFNNDKPILNYYGDLQAENIGDINNIEPALLHKFIDQNSEEKVEQRAHQRFKVTKEAFALIRPACLEPIRIQGKSMSEIACAVFRSKITWVGKINNISPGGLTCHYIKSKEQYNQILEMDILLAGSGFYLKNVLFKIVADVEIDDVMSADIIKTRQLQVQFHSLTAYQKSQLEDFIRNHATCEVHQLL